MGQRSLTGHAKMVHNFAALFEDHLQDIPEQSWHSFQIKCLNFVQSYRQGNEQPTTQHQPTLEWKQSWQPIQPSAGRPSTNLGSLPSYGFGITLSSNSLGRLLTSRLTSKLKSRILHRRRHRKFISQELLMFVGL